MRNIDKVKFKKAVSVAFIVLLALSIAGILLFAQFKKQGQRLHYNGRYLFAKAYVEEITFDDTDSLESDDPPYQAKQEMRVRVLNGSHRGELLKLRNTIEAIDVYKIILRAKDKVVINYTENDSGKMTSAHVYELVREDGLLLLLGVFVLSVLLVCRMKGFKSLLTLVLTAIMIICGLLPLLAAGCEPLSCSILVCSVTISASIFFIIGINKKSIIACIGTLGGILVSALCAIAIGRLCRITGLADTEAQMLAYTNGDLHLDFQSILFASIIIGALGAIMDVSVSMASSMEEIRRVNPDISKKEFIKSGLNVGRDIIGSMSNTLILAYMGGAFGLVFLLYAQRMSIWNIVNMEIVAKEIITALAGSLGLVWTVPFVILVEAYALVCASGRKRG